MKNALLPRIMAVAHKAQSAYKTMQATPFDQRIDWAARDKMESEIEAEMAAIDKEAGEGLAVGRRLSFGVGDGGADYIITKIRKNDVVVEWIPLCDHYFSQAVGLSADKRNHVVLRSTAEQQCRASALSPMFA